MTDTLENFCADATAALKASSGIGGREAVRCRLEKLLNSIDFIQLYLVNQSRGKKILFEDPETGFLINAHGISKNNKIGKPHDHGTSWAIYGQASGLTNMTVWEQNHPVSKSEIPSLTQQKTFVLKPGNAALFDTGIIHSTAHPAPARWVRITGTDLNTIKRYTYDPATGTKKLMRPKY